MAKATKPKPRPKKQPVSSQYIDDEAQDSDEGVMVERLATPFDHNGPVDVKREARDTDLEDDDDNSFINDGDPFDDAAKNSDASGKSTPPPSSSRLRKRSSREVPAPPDTPSPSKTGSKSQVVDEVIEVDSTSEEDLEAMDVDDSNFRKPPGVKPSALPPGLKTRSSAKRDASSSQPPADDHRSTKRAKAMNLHSDDEEPAFMAKLDDEEKRAMVLWMTSGSSQSRASKGKPTSTRLVSPDWEPPYSGDVSDDVAGNKPSSARTPPPRKSNGKAKAISPETSDWEPPPPEKLLENVVAKKSNTRTPKKSASPSKTAKSKSSSSKASRSKVSGDLTGYVSKREPPAAMASGGNKKGEAPLTMAQYLRQSRGEPISGSDDDGDGLRRSPSPPPADSTVFLEDLETYKASYNAKARCGVFDIALQDKSIREHYLALPPLPSLRRLLAAFDRHRNSEDDSIEYTTGGRVQFSSWYKQLPRMIASNSMGAILFEQSEPNYINLSRVSPLRLSTRLSHGSSATQRLYVDARIAVCLSAICVTECHLVAPRKIAPRSDRRRKYISGVFHDQDWERFVAIVNLVFGNTVMYAQMVDKSISFQTKISPEEADTDRPANSGVPDSMFSTPSPVKSSSGKAAGSSKGKTLLEFDDPVPVYDARRVAVDFGADLDRLGRVLPLFSGEIPPGSFAVVGYSCSAYSKSLVAGSVKVPHVGLNVLWVIVCGVPSA